MRKTEGKYFPVQTKQMRLIDFYYMAFGSFSSLFLALCSSSGVAVYLTSELVGSVRFMFTPVICINLPRL